MLCFYSFVVFWENMKERGQDYSEAIMKVSFKMAVARLSFNLYFSRGWRQMLFKEQLNINNLLIRLNLFCNYLSQRFLFCFVFDLAVVLVWFCGKMTCITGWPQIPCVAEDSLKFLPGGPASAFHCTGYRSAPPYLVYMMLWMRSRVHVS